MSGTRIAHGATRPLGDDVRADVAYAGAYRRTLSGAAQGFPTWYAIFLRYVSVLLVWYRPTLCVCTKFLPGALSSHAICLYYIPTRYGFVLCYVSIPPPQTRMQVCCLPKLSVSTNSRTNGPTESGYIHLWPRYGSMASSNAAAYNTRLCQRSLSIRSSSPVLYLTVLNLRFLVCDFGVYTNFTFCPPIIPAYAICLCYLPMLSAYARGMRWPVPTGRMVVPVHVIDSLPELPCSKVASPYRPTHSIPCVRY
eukprot:2186673-Rhodomonas_salina.4